MEETDFSGVYRSLMSAYRLSPEASARQLAAILRRVSAGVPGPPHSPGRQHKQKLTGGAAHERS